VVALALELASDASFVVLFRLLFDRLPKSDARLLGWTEQASGALLPGGGAGGLAIGGWLMHVAGAPTSWILRRSGAVFWLTSAVNSATLIGAGLAAIAGAPGPHGFALVVVPTMLAAALTAVVLGVPGIARSLKRCPQWVNGIATGVRDAEETTFKHPSCRLVGALGYLGFDIAVLWVCLRALGHPPPSRRWSPGRQHRLSRQHPADSRWDRRSRGGPDGRADALRSLADPRGRLGARLPRHRAVSPRARRPARRPAPTAPPAPTRQPRPHHLLI